jgi:hypothetical protein
MTLIDPDERLVVVVLNNTHGTVGLASSLATTVVKILDFALASGEQTGTWSPETYTGRFMNLWAVLDVACFGPKLVALNPDDSDPTSHATELEVVDADTLRIGRTSGYGSRGETVRYERGLDGAITRLWFAGASYLPAATFAEQFRQLASVGPAPA